MLGLQKGAWFPATPLGPCLRGTGSIPDVVEDRLELTGVVPPDCVCMAKNEKQK